MRCSVHPQVAGEVADFGRSPNSWASRNDRRGSPTTITSEAAGVMALSLVGHITGVAGLLSMLVLWP